jgi:hypothetical protein
MNIYIPLATGQSVDPLVIDSIQSQSLKLNIVKCESPGEINSKYNHSQARIIGEPISRNMGINICLRTRDPYFFMQNGDTANLNDSNFMDLADYLLENKSFGACALHKIGSIDSHIDIASICIRREVLEKGFRFENRYGTCLCLEVMEDLKNLKVDYGYLNHNTHIKSLNSSI